jgi:hypothetical protein
MESQETESAEEKEENESLSLTVREEENSQSKQYVVELVHIMDQLLQGSQFSSTDTAHLAPSTN